MLAVVFMVNGNDQPGHDALRLCLEGDLTVLADGRLALMTPDEAVHDLGALVDALVGEPRDPLGDRHVGRVRLTVEVVDRHERLNGAGFVPLARRRSKPPAVG